MHKIPEITTRRLLLKPLGTGHLSQNYVDWLNDPEVYKYLETGGDYSLEKLEEYLKEVEKKNIYFWAIHLKENDKHIGNIKIDPINYKHGYGEYGILMGCKEEWGKGYAKEASLAVIDYCFKELQLRKITLGVVEGNIRAFLLYKKMGFELEGVYKKHGFYENKYQDVFRMALFNPKLR